MTGNINDTLSQRAKSHGKYEDHTQYAQEIKDIIQKSVSYDKLSQDQRETLHMIAHKMGRILAGNPDFFDHWHDIAGYATLSAKLCSDAPKSEPEGEEEYHEEVKTGARYEVQTGFALGSFYVKDTLTGTWSYGPYDYETACIVADGKNSKELK